MNWWTAPNPSTLMFKKSVFLGIGSFDIKPISCEDHDLWLTIGYRKIKVKGIKESLSYFSHNNSGRLSLNYNKRFIGMNQLLFKWEETIKEEMGSKHYKWFSDKYKHNAAYPIFTLLLKKGKLFKSMNLFYRYLIFNSIFYSHLKQKIRRVL